MKRLLLAPLFLTLLLSPAKGQQIGRKYISELNLAEDKFGFITYMSEEYKQFGIKVKEAYPDGAKEYSKKATYLVNKASDLIDYQRCLKKNGKKR